MEQSKLKEAVGSAVQSLMEQIQAGKSEALSTYLAAMGRFHSYSFGNVMLIAMQRPTATRVAGFNRWKELNRFVKKGEKGIMILAPMVGKRKSEDAEEEQPARSVVYGFRTVYVFDVEQTDGEPLPEFDVTVSGDVSEYRAGLDAFLASRGIAVSYNAEMGTAFGLSYGGRIELLPGRPAAEEFCTLVHEAAHELLHRGDRRKETSRDQRELEAESVAFVVGQAIGLNMGTTSSDYIQVYSGNVEALQESLEQIQNTAREILAALTSTEQQMAA